MLVAAAPPMFGVAGIPRADGDDTPARGALGTVLESIWLPLLYAFEKKLPMELNKFGTAGALGGVGAGAGARESDLYWVGVAMFANGFASAENALVSDGTGGMVIKLCC